MKKTLAIILMLLSVMILTACKDEKYGGVSIANNPYQMGDIDDRVYVLENGETVVFPFNGKIYAATSWSEGSIGYYDTADSMKYTALAKIPTHSMYVWDGGITAISNGSIVQTDHTGTVMNSWDISETVKLDNGYHTELGVSSDYIAAAFVMSDLNDEIVRFLILDQNDGSVYNGRIDGGYEISYVHSIRPIDSETFAISAIFTDEFGKNSGGVFHFSAKDMTVRYKYSFENCLGSDCVNGIAYGISNDLSVYRLLEMNEDTGKGNVLRVIGADTHIEKIRTAIGIDEYLPSSNDLFYTGYNYLIWDKEQHVLTVYGTYQDENAKTLTIMYPVSIVTDEGIRKPNVGDVEYAMMKFEEMTGCRVEAITYPITEYADRLRMKLLAGEDDVDVVFLDKCDEGDLFASILRYKLYLPLNGYSKITDNYQSFADGVKEYMTVNGELIGIPYEFSGEAVLITDQYKELGLPEISSNWTLDDFYALCDMATEYCSDTTALAPYPHYWLIKAIIQNGINNGKLEYDEIYNAVERIKTYGDKGVFAKNRREVDEFLLEYVPVPPQSHFGVAMVNGNEFVPFPTIDGNRYAALSSFSFIYSKSSEPELAAEFLAMLSGEEFAPLIESGKTYFMKDSSSYYNLIWGDNFTQKYERFKWNRVDIELSDVQQTLAKAFADVFPGTSMLTIDNDDMTSKIVDEFNRLMDGETTVKGTADAIYEYAMYRYFE